mmetsp:Transcript_3654/g.11770  ORF Transcript_3654/g.11770 Transcript_3654/m.11770 type:complete len:202 (-) Transcript_3654:59-664(-)
MRGGRRGRVARGGEGHSSRALSRLAGPLRPKRGRDGRWCCSGRSSRVARPVLRRSRRVRGRGTAVRQRRRASRSSQQPEKGPSPAKELPTARAEETASLGLGSAAILYARCTPSRRTRGDGRLARAASAATERCPPGRCLGRALVAPRRRLRPEGRERLKARSRNPAVQGAWRAERWPSRPGRDVAKGGELRRATGQGRRR